MYSNNDYLNKLYHDQRHAELMKRREHRLLLRQAAAGHRLHVPLLRPAVGALGYWMVRTGRFLQRQSGMWTELQADLTAESRVILHRHHT